MRDIQAGSRIAILADVHGNTLALEAVLSDIESRGGADGYWFLGDYAAIGYDPVGVLERISQIDNAVYIRGNTDRYLVDGSLPWPHQEDVDRNPELSPLHAQVGRSFAWTTGAVAVTGWLPWLRDLPLEYRAKLPDGEKVLLVHAAPGKDDGDGIHPKTDDGEMRPMVESVDAELVLVGHTHLPFDHRAGSVRIVNPGSVSNPLPPDLRACYALLLARSNSYELQFHRVEFDLEAVIERSQSVNHPAWEFIASHMRGDRRPDWMEGNG